MAEETRVGFHRDLEEIDQKVVQLFALVAESVAKATDAFLANDREAAESLSNADAVIDQLYCDVEDLVQRQFALQSPMARDMRFLLSVLRIVPELERSGDLAEHIAARAMRGVRVSDTPRVARAAMCSARSPLRSSSGTMRRTDKRKRMSRAIGDCRANWRCTSSSTLE